MCAILAAAAGGRRAMKSQIKGNTMPVLEIGLEPNGRIVAEPGELSGRS